MIWPVVMTSGRLSDGQLNVATSVPTTVVLTTALPSRLLFPPRRHAALLDAWLKL